MNGRPFTPVRGKPEGGRPSSVKPERAGSTVEFAVPSLVIETGEPAKSKLEQQVILRLPPDLAELISKRIQDQTLRSSAITIHPIDDRNVRFRVEGVCDYPGTLVDLPCIIESQKTWDNAAYYKSADISQMLIVRTTEDEANVPPVEFPSGITPPTTNIREKRFRKPQFPREDIVKAEGHLWSILQGQPQVQYELIEEEVEVDEDQEEESGSGDEWEDEDDEEDEEEENENWASVRSGMTGSVLRETPMTDSMMPSPSPSPRRFAVPSTGPLQRPTTMTPFTPSMAESAAPSPGPTPSSPMTTVIRATSTLNHSDLAQTPIIPLSSMTAVNSSVSIVPMVIEPTETVVATEEPMSIVLPAAVEEEVSAENVQKAETIQALTQEVAELESRIEDLRTKAQTLNKILKKRYTKNLEDAQSDLNEKRALLEDLINK